MALTGELARRMVLLTGLASNVPEAERLVTNALASGAAIERFRLMVEAQGGDPSVVDDPSRLEISPGEHVMTATGEGILRAVRADLVGMAAMALGAGRACAEDTIDFGVGVTVHQHVGAAVTPADPLLTLHHREGRGLSEAIALAAKAVDVGEQPPAGLPPLVLCEVR
jgi:thymidine phosphorylase